jgi:hypothetical protein
MGRKTWAQKQREKEAVVAAAKLALETRRVDTQRALFAALDPCAAKDRLLAMMRDRVIGLFDNCQYEAADFILEFMPETEVVTILDQYFIDEM